MRDKKITIIDGGDSSCGINGAEATIDLSQWYHLNEEELSDIKDQLLEVFNNHCATSVYIFEPPQEVTNNHIKTLVQDTFKSIRQDI